MLEIYVNIYLQIPQTLFTPIRQTARHVALFPDDNQKVKQLKFININCGTFI